MVTLRGPGTVASKRRSGTTGDIGKALTAIDKGFVRHGARFTARLASFCEGEASFGIARLYHNVQPSLQDCRGRVPAVLLRCAAMPSSALLTELTRVLSEEAEELRGYHCLGRSLQDSAHQLVQLLCHHCTVSSRLMRCTERAGHGRPRARTGHKTVLKHL
jgi:hypothetical protein